MQTLFRKYIGGRDIQELSQTIHALHERYGIHPIIDFVLEGYGNSERYVKEVERCAAAFPQGGHVYAVKLSNFMHGHDGLYLRTRARALLDKLTASNNTVLIDAEDVDMDARTQEYTRAYMRDYNSDGHVRLYKTYQMYRSDAMARLMRDLDAMPCPFGVKLVRGGYLFKDGRKPELYKSIDYTHTAYMAAAEQVLRSAQTHPLMLATHNDAVLDWMKRHPLARTHPRLSFAQLLGMNDAQSLSLKEQGFAVYKYVPYGTQMESLPYLVRRLYENKSVLKYLQRPMIDLSSKK